MPSRPEKTIGLYQEEQAQAYADAVTQLEECGEVGEDTPEGEKVAALARRYLAETDTQKSDSQPSRGGISWDMASLILGIVGVLFILGAIAVGVFLAADAFVL